MQRRPLKFELRLIQDQLNESNRNMQKSFHLWIHEKKGTSRSGFRREVVLISEEGTSSDVISDRSIAATDTSCYYYIIITLLRYYNIIITLHHRATI